MGILDKVEKWGTIAVVGVAAWMLWANWDNIRNAFCKLPGAVATGWCGDNPLECKLTMQDCWTQKGSYSEVDIANCSCTDSIDPKTGCNTLTEHYCGSGVGCYPNNWVCPSKPDAECVVGSEKCVGIFKQECIEPGIWFTNITKLCQEFNPFNERGNCECGFGEMQMTQEAREHYSQYGEFACLYACKDREIADDGGGGGLNRCDCPNGGITFPEPGQSCADACQMEEMTDFDKCYYDMCNGLPGQMVGNCWSLDIYGTAWKPVGSNDGQCVNTAVVSCRARCNDPVKWEVWNG